MNTAILMNTNYFQSIWFPNIIYVEEPVYDKFLKSLKYNISKYNAGREKFNENGIENRKILNNFIEEKQGQGYEVRSLHSGN